jgi:hypothetical protein
MVATEVHAIKTYQVLKMHISVSPEVRARRALRFLFCHWLKQDLDLVELSNLMTSQHVSPDADKNLFAERCPESWPGRIYWYGLISVEPDQYQIVVPQKVSFVDG